MSRLAFFFHAGLGPDSRTWRLLLGGFEQQVLAAVNYCWGFSGPSCKPFELQMSLRSLRPAEPLCAACSAEETMGRRELRFYTSWPSCHPVPRETVSLEGSSCSAGSQRFWGRLHTASLSAMRNLASRTLHKSGHEGKGPLSLVWSCSALKGSRFSLSWSLSCCLSSNCFFAFSTSHRRLLCQSHHSLR